MDKQAEVEEWRDIPGFEPYQASNLGRIKGKRKRIITGAKIKTPERNAGRIMICMCIAAGQVTRLRSRLVCLAFYGPPPFPDAEACHNDGSKDNDRADNLRWGTRSENSLDAVRHGTHSQIRFTEEQIRVVLEARANGFTQKQAAALVGMSQKHLSNIENGIRRKDVTCSR